MLSKLKKLINRLSIAQLKEMQRYINSLLEEKEQLKIELLQKREVVERIEADNITYQLEYVRCGKENCKCNNGQKHGPYWYSYFWKNGKLVSKYWGKEKPIKTEKVLIDGLPAEQVLIDI